MEDKVKNILESDLLEKYLLGTTSTEEDLRAERYISLYPEVRKAYHTLEDNLKEFASLYAVPAPEDSKSTILGNIKSSHQSKHNRLRRWSVAASVVAIAFAATSFFFWNKNQKLSEENMQINHQIALLEENFNNKLSDLRNQFIVKNNPNTKKYSFKGNRTKNLKAIAYVNPVKKLSYLNIGSLPEIPEDKSLQMWVEIDGKLESLGLLTGSEKDKMLAIPYKEKAKSYHITLEQKGGNIVASQDRAIGEVAIK
ncbi:MAG: anti-sigma factor [Flavobacteriaceae bacterium]|nr:anti-sigma factor [Flavobacteriaceae bacterium]